MMTIEINNCGDDFCGDDFSGDDYNKLNIDALFLLDRVKILNKKYKKTSWYRIRTLLSIQKELKEIKKERDEINERLERLYAKKQNPIDIIRRQ